MDGVSFDRVPPHDNNILVLAFSGWSDAGTSATSAVGFLREKLEARTFATIDPDPFYDFQQTRPHVRVENGLITDLTWPVNEYAFAERDDGGLILGSNHEPNYRWRSFVACVLEIIEQTGADRVYGLGALLADVPHTRPTRIVSTGTSEAIVTEIGFEGAEYEGPTGVTGVLHRELSTRGIEAATMWASVPHYVSAAPNPKGTLALLEALLPLLSIAVDLDELREKAEDFEQQIDQAMASSPEVSAYVRLLEGRADAQADTPLVKGNMPTGDEIADELQRFLRLQEDED